MFGWGAIIFFNESKPPADAMEICVTGKQWMWKIQHLEGTREINELHIPVNRNIRLTLTSEDVIHDFYVPAFRTKTDVVPGRYTTEWFRPTKVGEYHLFCAEYCGTKHSGMIGTVYVMNESDYEAWLTGGARGNGSMAEKGEALFQQLGCVTCHQVRRQGTLSESGRIVRHQGGAERRSDGDCRCFLHPRIDRESAGQDRRTVMKASCRRSRVSLPKTRFSS